MFIPDLTFFHPGSRIRTVSIPDPGSSSKNLSILTPKKPKKWFLSSKKYDPGCSSRIRMLTFSHPRFRIQGSKRHPIPDPDPQHWFLRFWFRNTTHHRGGWAHHSLLLSIPYPSPRIQTNIKLSSTASSS
jgi:hypothetical protein